MSNAYINFTFESKTDWVKKINECQEEIERQKEIIRQLDIKNLELTTIIKEINNVFNDNNISNNMQLVRKIRNILKGVDKVVKKLTEKDKRQIKGLKEEFKIGDKE